MGWVAARLRAGPIPTLRSLWRGPSLRRTEGGRRERCERPCGAQGSVSPVGCWAEGPKRPEAHRREASALWAVARSAKRPAGAPEGSVCPVGTWAEGPKRPGGVSKYKGCARSARRTPIFASEQIQGLCAASAQNADICEGSETMSATVREARMIEQPGARNAACGRQRRIPQELCSPRPVRSPAARARSCRGRRVPAPTARAVRPHQPRNPHRASVSSALAAQETRLPAPRGAYRRAFRPHPSSEVWRAAALQAEIRIPGSFSKSSIWRRHPARARDRLPASSGRPASLTCAVNSPGAPPGGKDRRQPSFSAALYSIIASASLTSSIRRATCAGVSTGWLNSTVWFTVTAGAAACAACAVWRPS